MAAERENQREVVELLLSDPRVDPNRGLDEAIRMGHTEIFKLLLADLRTDLSNNGFKIMSMIDYYQRASRGEMIKVLQKAVSERKRS